MAKTAKKAVETAAEPLCKLRVTKMGDGLISNGVHQPGLGDEFYEHNEEFEAPASVAFALQDRGYAEIQGKEPARPKKPREVEAEKEQDGEWQ